MHRQARPSESDPSTARLLCFILLLLVAISACAANQPYMLKLMPAPDIFAAGGWQPFSDTNPQMKTGNIEILYATDRKPAKRHKEPPYYRNERGYVLRLGKGEVTLGKGIHTWEEMKKVSLLKNRTEDLPLQVTGVSEYGILDTTLSEFEPPEVQAQKSETAAREYAAVIDAKLAQSVNKDIYVYVPGFKVNFENPLLVASELWHFIGYDGVFIAYAWPSTPSVFAYAADAETAAVSARNLRLFLQYLSQATTAKEIHLVGYSAGTRLVTQALGTLALIGQGADAADREDRLRLGHVILVGSDVDRGVFVHMLLDGILTQSRSMNVYVSTGDQALGVSQWVFSRTRLGQLMKGQAVEKNVVTTLRNLKKLHFIDVSDAEGAMTGNGHAYFRKSPWTSSDILATLVYDMPPQQRGLTRSGDSAIWTFPPDYISRLKTALTKTDAALSEGEVQ